MVLTMYKLDASPPVRAVLMTIEVLNIPDVKYVDVNLLEGEHLKEQFLQINPQHTIPTITDDDFVIWDSHAITTYLVNKYARNDTLYPTDAKKKAIVDQRLHFDSGILFPAARGTLEPVLFWGEKTFRTENLNKIKSAYGLTDKVLTSPWLTGDEITLADICCVATISSLNEIIPIDKNTYPNLYAWLERCEGQEFYKKQNVPGLQLLRELIKSKLA